MSLRPVFNNKIVVMVSSSFLLSACSLLSLFQPVSFSGPMPSASITTSITPSFEPSFIPSTAPSTFFAIPIPQPSSTAVPTAAPFKSEAPNRPSSIQIEDIDNNSARVSWEAVTGAENYCIFLNGSEIGCTSNIRYSLRNLNANTQYALNVTALRSGLSSDKGPSQLFNTLDNVSVSVPPPVPSPSSLTFLEMPHGLSFSNHTENGFMVTWFPVEHASSYAVLKNGSLAGRVSTPSYTFTNLSSNSSITVQIRADGSGIVSEKTSPEKVYTLASAPTVFENGNIVEACSVENDSNLEIKVKINGATLTPLNSDSRCKRYDLSPASYEVDAWVENLSGSSDHTIKYIVVSNP